MELVILAVLLIVLDLAAARWGYDSREVFRRDRREQFGLDEV
jgi:hypothetical protein